MGSSPRLDEVSCLYESLLPEERDELLQCLLIAASKGGDSVTERLEECLAVMADRGSAEG